nr:hemocyanin 1 [Megathura crenulata]
MLSVRLLIVVLALANAENLVRKSVEHLTQEETLDLQAALRELQMDSSSIGFQKIAAAHGAPASCVHKDTSIACCIHGMPTFPHWHRAYVVHMERALQTKRRTSGLPYWDWTEPITQLPSLAADPVYIDSQGGKAHTNYWYRGNIDFLDKKTNRAVDDRLFEKVKPGQHTHLMESVLDALEQDEFCKFEIQFELAHNAIHYLVGGKHDYSMANLEYTAYDPIFFLHHSNVDRIFAIWQRLQELRNKDPKAMDCAQELLHQKMEPFSWEDNDIPLTNDYDTLNLNGMTPEELKTYLDERSSRARAFASFRLKGFGGSANVFVYVCIPDDNDRNDDHCEKAGDFFVLGGPSEMKWQFYRPYLFDLSDTVHKMGMKLDGHYTVKAELFSVNGTALPDDLLPHPVVVHHPEKGFTDPPVKHHQSANLLVRKNINDLTREEVLNLREAFHKFQEDRSVDGYQATAEYHGLPARCPRPDAKDRYACCVHGMPIFPHWHRLFVTQVEDALVGRGATIGIPYWGLPYWDWTEPMTHIPGLAGNKTYVDSHGASHTNPFHSSVIAFEENAPHTKRQIDQRLFKPATFGHHTDLFNQILYAFEQEDYCDFEVQFEITHNTIHAWTGGSEHFSMSSLHYTAFDPLFYFHHSNVDRLWAVWQALQMRRHKPYRAHCAISLEHMHLKPFAFSSPLNNNEKTHANAMPNKIYDYENVLHYTYEDLTFGGISLENIEKMIHENQQEDRIYAGFLLAGIRTSANVDIFIKTTDSVQHKAGTFAVLGGSKEMKWGFDRVFKFDITHVLKDLDLTADGDFEVTVDITEVDGTKLASSLIPHASVIREHARGKLNRVKFDKVPRSRLIRKNVDRLSPEEMNELRKALALLKEDKSAGGFQQLGAFHGEPKWCPSPEASKKFACCVHGMSVFPHWHRLLTVQSENALRRHGYDGALPYWDWTSPLNHLPELADHEKYVDPEDGVEKHNPWFDGHIDTVDKTTTRSVQNKLFEQPEFGHYTSIAKQVLLALEQDNFCDFEIQYEIAHNYIHALVGGAQPYGMASLRYTAFDPLFYLHHSNTDRIWAIWQALQKYRGKPYNVANCAVTSMREPLQPFGLSANINTDHVTKEHSVPFNVFDYKTNFNYEYDTLEFNGLSISQLNKKLEAIKSQDRFFAGFLLSGFKKSSLVKFNICTDSSNCHPAGEFYLLGDENEMPWAYDRVFKYDITEKLHDLKLHAEDHFYIDYEVFDLKPASLGKDLFKQPSVIHEPRIGHHEGEVYQAEVTSANRIRKNIENLSLGELESLRAAFLEIENDGTYESIAKFHGSPGLCQLNGNPISCCVHGMPTFPHWHRLYVVVVENALLKKGSSVAVPYWDWTKRIEHLPHLISDATYYNSRQHHYETNPFHHGKITHENEITTRDPKDSLFHSDYFYEQVLYALEQDNFCDFEIQLEILHNALHSLLGGKGKYSMSNLDYAAFDPVFFLHHATTDRIWAIWQDLQRFRKRPYREANCAIQLMHTPLQPFDKSDNNDEATKTHATPHDGFEYQNSFGYAYDNLELNHYSIPQLDHMLQERKRHDRVFAGFLLHNIGTSADGHVFVCLPTGEHTKDCSHEAGMFSILGGQTEMSFVFDRLYKLDITKALKKNGVHLQGDFDLEIEITAVNGSHLDSHVIHSPTILFEAGTDSAHTDDGHTEPVMIRKDITQLDKRQQLSLVKALESMKADHSSDGFQAIASFHALPPLCPSPAASKRFACCVHGMATFPQWHRLYTVQFQDSLRKHGAVVGLPYWDWTLPRSELPELLTVSTIHDPETGRDIPNPFIGSKIEFEGENVHTKRDINRDRLFQGSTKTHHNWFIEQALLALEQTNYCDFEVQFEIMHNGVHTWVGGKEPYGIGHLHYASYDPLFYIHHSQTDRIWAIWQSLQRFRGLSGSEANCAVNLMKTPLKPFSFGAPYNLNDHTHDFSKPEDTFDYQKFGYIYDTLEFAGWSIRGIDHIVRNRQEHSRVFAGFLLEGFGTSATVDFQVCRTAGDCEDAGYFTVLGGEKEMPWAFDRLYKYDITETLDKMNLRHDEIFQIEVTITSYDGTVLDSGLIPTPSIIYDPAHHDISSHHLSLNKVRHDLSTLSERDIGSLKYALSSLQADTSADGFAAIASFHGLPAKCNDSHNNEVACCIHGMPTFPHWHRLYTLQFEQALRRHGSSVAVPYWDWTKPIHNIPHLFTDKEYYDVWRNKVMPNPFARGYVPSHDTYTVRDVQEGLFHLTSTGEHSALLNQALLALEQHDYCDFAVQFEVMHNTIHYLVGGPQVYSLSSLHYASYDPIFFIHHSFVDKVWAVWQALQEKRGLPSDRADCAVSLMTQNMRPFHYEINHNQFTKKHAVPNDVFKYELLGYRYDNLEIGGMNLHEIEKEIKDKQHHVRVFAGFLLHGIRTSADVQFQICKTSEDCHHGGQIFVLGGTKEMAWAYNRLFKYDITHALHDAHITPEDVFHPSEPFFIKVSVTAVNGTVLPASILHAPTIIYEPGLDHHEDHHSSSMAGHGVRKEINTLTTAEVDNLKDAMRAVMADHGPNGYQAIAAFHGNPPMCPMPDGKNYSCCTHGMATFPHWHRLYTKQMEDALTAHGARVGLPYWDGTTAFTALPTFVTDEEDNPFHHGHIDYLGVDTTRSPRDKLFNDPERGSESFFYRQVLLALEQTDFCQFEVQFEITHNAIHSWTGGLTPYGMSTLEYTTYDPLFWLHHANTDRIWAIWQALQEYRGLPYDHANCEIQAMKRPLRPFSDPINHNAFTHSNAKPTDVFEYSRFNFQYDNLRFHGMTIKKLEHELEKQKEEDRTFAAFLLHGIKKSADVSFDVCNHDGECHFAGTFAILGGEHEMPWSFDRLFRYDITQVLKQMHLEYDSDFTFHMRIIDTSGKQLPSDLIKMPTVEHSPGGKHHEKHHEDHHEDILVRKNIHSLSHHEAEELRDALYKLQNDESHGGYEHIAGFHGYPNLCPEKGDEKYPCCVHGMSIFPHWHRLHTIQFERALKKHGSHLGIPYWDWTQTISSLPTFFADSGNNNPFFKYHIRSINQDTVRDVNEAIFQQTKFGEFSSIFYLALQALEEDNYCDFEVQYEILHNEVHALIGGAEKYSMSTLEYSAFDPYFMIHHASLDKIWIIWQELQKRRVKPAHAGSCAGDIMHVPLHPFNYESVNNDDFTRENSLPNAVVDSHRFNYKYDNLNLHGHNIEELEEVLRSLRLKSRVFAGFVLSGIRTTAVVKVYIKSGTDSDDEYAGSFVILGGAKEMPWAYERLYRFDITETVHNLNLTDDHVKFRFDLKKYDHTELDASVLPAPIIVRRPNNAVFDIIEIPIGKDVNLPPKVVVKRGTKIMFMSVDEAVTTPMLNLGSYTAMFKCKVPPFSFHAFELGKMYSVESGDYFMTASTTELCNDNNLRIHVHVDDE